MYTFFTRKQRVKKLEYQFYFSFIQYKLLYFIKYYILTKYESNL